MSELVPAIGIGIGAGLFAFYVTRLLLQRTPLRAARREASELLAERQRGA